MITIFLLFLIGITLLFQSGTQKQLRHLHYRYDFDRTLAGPGEEITMTSSLENHSRYPILYAGLSEFFPGGITPISGPIHNQSRHSRGRQPHTDYMIYLPPHRVFNGQVSFSFPERGIYTLGRYYLKCTDFLGFSGQVRSGDLDKKLVIMPERTHIPEILQSLGGYLGDVSVRRFLPEDPILTVGSREYTGHEPMKSIDWIQTARSGKLLVKQYDHTAERDAAVLLNLYGCTREEAEECLRITRTVCEELEKKRIPYAFYTNGDIRTPTRDLSHTPRGLGKAHWGSIMHGLGASKCHALNNLSQLVDLCARFRRTDGGCILITPPLKEKDADDVTRLQKLSSTQLLILTAAVLPTGGDRK